MNWLLKDGQSGYETSRLNSDNLLWRLADDYTDIIKRQNDHSVKVLDFVETPYDEYGIVDRVELYKKLLGVVASGYVWAGNEGGPHHIYWPRSSYGKAKFNDERCNIVANFRGSPLLKVSSLREPHDFLHRLTMPPKQPSFDVMRQFYTEQLSILGLYANLSPFKPEWRNLPEEKINTLRYKALLNKLESLPDSQLGVFPERETLANLPINETYMILRKLCSPLYIDANNPEWFT